MRKFYGLARYLAVKLPALGVELHFPKIKQIKYLARGSNNIIQEGFFGFGKVVDFQNWVSYDMLGKNYQGHQHLRPILMPEIWISWPFRTKLYYIKQKPNQTVYGLSSNLNQTKLFREKLKPNQTI